MKKMIIASICVALGVVLSTTSIPIGPARIFPFQHMINVILAVIVGARFSVGAAFSTSAYLYKKYNAIWAAALGEIIGTGLIGALVSYPIAHFLLGKPLALLTLITSFSMSSIGGACIGFVVLQILSRRNLLHKEA